MLASMRQLMGCSYRKLSLFFTEYFNFPIEPSGVLGIVNRASEIKRLEDLRGRVFAFTDPDSNSGKLVPTYWLNRMGEQPKSFFGKTIYTYSHDNSILAVSRALVDGAAVDGLIWEYYEHKNPAITAKTRVVKKSQPFGIPPVVASSRLTGQLKEQIRRAFFALHRDGEGQKILKELMIARFVAPRDEWYASIRKIKRSLAVVENQSHASFQP
jgi:phosphonate transport system substrate-binding protein